MTVGEEAHLLLSGLCASLPLSHFKKRIEKCPVSHKYQKTFCCIRALLETRYIEVAACLCVICMSMAPAIQGFLSAGL